MELRQSYSWAVVTPYKNYCEIPDSYGGVGLKLTPPPQSLEDDLDCGNIFLVPVVTVNVDESTKKKKKDHLYYYPYDQVGCQLQRISENNIITDNDDEIRRYYGDPFVSIIVTNRVRKLWVEKDVIKMKYYYVIKERTVNHKYFRRLIFSWTVSFNTRTGNFIATEYIKEGVKLKKFHRCNHFPTLSSVLSIIFDGPYSRHGFVPNTIIEHFNEEVFIDYLKKLFSVTVNVPCDLNFNRVAFYSWWISVFIYLKKIKVPDDLNQDLLSKLYPTERYLKKNNRKLLSSVLDSFGLKCNVGIKILHETRSSELILFARVHQIFGCDYPKYLGNLYRSVPSMFLGDKTTIRLSNPKWEIEGIMTSPIDLSPTEKSNIYKIIVDFWNGRDHDGGSYEIWRVILDHHRMMTSVKPYYPDTSIKSTTYSRFMEHHTILSKISSKISSGFEYELVYDENLLRVLEEPFVSYKYGAKPFLVSPDVFMKIETVTFTVKVLTKTSEYDEEGEYMSHCVAGYVTSDSLIVSVRCGTDRVTCEFNPRTKEVYQMRYFKNTPPPDYFIPVLDRLRERIMSYPYSIKHMERRQIPLMINGIPVKENIFTSEIIPQEVF